MASAANENDRCEGPPRAAHRCLRRFATIAAVALIAGSALIVVGRLRQWRNFHHAEEVVELLLTADFGDLPAIQHEMESSRQLIDQLLEARYQALPPLSPGRLRINLLRESLNAEQKSELAAATLDSPLANQQSMMPLLTRHRAILEPECWRVLDDQESRPASRFRAACILCGLASVDPSRWPAASEVVAAQLTAELADDGTLFDWLAALLQPVSSSLRTPLATIAASDDAPDARRQIAARLLVAFARDDPEQLVDVLSFLDGRPAAEAARRLADMHEEVALLARSASSQPYADVQDPPTGGADSVNAETAAMIESAGGLVDSRFAFCVALKLSDCDSVLGAMGDSGYRPIRLRPYGAATELRVAIAWTRDAQPWKTRLAATAEEIRRQAKAFQKDGYQPEDISAYHSVPPTGPSQDTRFAAIWIRSKSKRPFYVGVPHDENESRIEDFAARGLQPLTLHTLRTKEGSALYSSIWTTGGRSTIRVEVTYPTVEVVLNLGWLPVDLCLSAAPVQEPSFVRYQRQLEQADKLLSESDSLTARYSRALANYRLGRNQPALDDLNQVIAKAPTVVSLYRYRAVTHARLQNDEEARQDLDYYLARSQNESSSAFARALVEAHLSNPEKAAEQFDAQLDLMDDGFTYDAACLYSLLSQISADDDQSRKYADRAVTLVRRSIEYGYRDFVHMAADSDLDPIRSRADFQSLAQPAAHPWRYSIASVLPNGRQGDIVTDVNASAHLRSIEPLIASGYKITSISVVRDADSNEPLVTSVWDRPQANVEQRQAWVRRRAAAAAFLAKQGRAEIAWRLLAGDAAADTRSQLIEKLAALSVPAELVEQQIPEAVDSSQLAALLLALGNYPDAAFPAERREVLQPQVLDLYRRHNDAEVHAAATWLLTRWGCAGEIASVDAQLAGIEPPVGSEWSVNEQGQTMILFRGPIEFDMGSPPHQAHHAADERRHRRSMNRSFSLAAAPITQAQFARFLTSRGDRYKGDFPAEADNQAADLPQTHVTWFAAAAYCNWLSERKGLPLDQWCYLPNEAGEYAEGMKPAADYLSRRGYRLPHEAEWEYACRGGSESAWFFGNGDELLARYAWHGDNALHGPCPVGRLKPNQYGMFDMLGNIWEWCHERYGAYPPGRVVVDDGDWDEVTATESRVLRGGAYASEAAQLRSAARGLIRPGKHSLMFGFRVARTEFPESSLTP